MSWMIFDGFLITLFSANQLAPRMKYSELHTTHHIFNRIAKLLEMNNNNLDWFEFVPEWINKTSTSRSGATL